MQIEGVSLRKGGKAAHAPEVGLTVAPADCVPFPLIIRRDGAAVAEDGCSPVGSGEISTGDGVTQGDEPTLTGSFIEVMQSRFPFTLLDGGRCT